MKNPLTSSIARWTLAAAVAASTVTFLELSRRARADGPTTAPAVSAADVEKKMDKDYEILQQLVSTPEELLDPANRAKIAPKAIPAYRTLIAEIDELAVADPDRKEETDSVRSEYLTMLSLFQDKPATDLLDKLAQSKEPNEKLTGEAGKLMVQWLSNSGDSAKQGQIVDQMSELAKANPESDPLTSQLMEMAMLGPSNEALSGKLKGLISGTMRSPSSEGIRQQMQAEQKMAALEGQPMTLVGKTVEGKDFSTADWKGKVILVDFWATWCGPCVAELPRVKKIYAENHANGLEILGVSNDQSAEDLTNFLAKNPDMPWPQLFDPKAGENWHPITMGYGITGIPTMFLIDKKGICRSVTAREKMETLIPKLLAE